MWLPDMDRPIYPQDTARERRSARFIGLKLLWGRQHLEVRP